ncbi:1-(5-phosphoribosyl)-5-[(5-phosphoribosylamino)methylideneamino]imidazole-4-carboxamide isomerase [Chryseolinea lacunae]|uniref:1-(5-phosphoribosyl)-5-[(5-phosphoribosylamino)methylideneamino] imidazole-4-carboxamide isomerase n=1 Tax=Chryseolinea lacunae TaxID=2801331 RepID=A0ABS1KXJ5_9BACT|nr:1-(5-phosphoribosyl)-5-[(5-phosphoribosylamino)methylideneamino]imidazole-4-carboxamide isomerase [Chryseolinea lacunae]MBL0744094.1 1-(5-phosphoribosyl)-5-[(5-phosphoribosylamino)methylideneamino]imidazole-4-carboxamide isomerase [Chryseolinea lacunae]
MRIIPAIDIIDGKCVRLTQGDYAQKKIYHEDPVQVARSFEEAGLTDLHVVDLDGAKAGKVVNWKVVEDIAKNTGLAVDFGGGIKTEEEIDKLLNLGVKQVNLGSVAVKEPLKVISWLKKFGKSKIILSADVKGEFIAISGWQESSPLTLFSLLKDYTRNGIEYVTCTDISTDGMLTGPNIELYKNILMSFPQLNLVASGGVSNLEDLRELKRIGADGAIVGKAIYEGRITLEELKTL